MRKLLLLLLTAAPVLAASITPAEYAARRARLASAAGPNAVVFIFSAAPAHRNGDVDYPYRQASNMLYLTGITGPDTTLVLLPDEPKEIAFVRDRNPQRELWTGRIPTHEAISAISGIKTVQPAAAASRLLAGLVNGVAASAYDPPTYPAFLRAVREGKGEVWIAFPPRRDDPSSPEQQFAAEVQKRFPELKIHDASPLLRAMRQIKSPGEIALLERAVAISDAGQEAGMKRALTAKSENQVQATIEYTFREMGACCGGYPSIVASGPNATTLHYENDDAPIVRDGLMLVDVGAEVEGYTADVTRTYPANGKFSAPQRAIYEAVLAAQNASLELMRPGHTFKEMNQKAVATLGSELLRLGLITRNEPAQVRWYLPYLISHPIGLDVHDVIDPGVAFAPNMVVTNEPGVYVRADDVVANETFKALPAAEQQKIRVALETYKDIGVRIEDDVLVTDGPPRILSAHSPRTIGDIEALLGK